LDLPETDSHGSTLAGGAQAFVHVAPICPINVAAMSTLDLIGILVEVRTQDTAMATTSLAIIVYFPDLHGKAISILPMPVFSFNFHDGSPCLLTLQA